MDSGHQGPAPPMAPSRVVGTLTNSSSNSGVFFPDGSQTVVNPHMIQAAGRSTMVDVNVGASSLVTDANSALTGGGGPNLQRSSSINTESYMRLPASPISFSSNNISVSGSSIMDGGGGGGGGGSCILTQDQVLSQQGGGASSATSSLPSGQVPFSNVRIMEDGSSLSHKKPRLDMKQEDILQQQVVQNMVQKQGQVHLQNPNPNPQMQALMQQQQRMRQQQKMLPSLQSTSPLPSMQRAQLQQQQQQILRNQMQSVPAMSGVCARRLMQYLYHQRQRQADNSILYWRKFVSEYYSPRAKKRWCLSLYDCVSHNALGVFPQAAMDVWHCDICNTKPGRGFEATFEILPRLNEIKFQSGVKDEQLFLDLPREFRFPSGVMVLEYAKAVQDTVYEHIRVIREGHLRVTFAPDLKILHWEFCARRHDELLPRRAVAPQVNQLLQVAQKCQMTITESGPEGVSPQDLQNNSNMVLVAGRQLAKSLELQSLNDLGFSKRYIRCLQIAEVVNSMKDLIDFCQEQRVGPIEGLKAYSNKGYQQQQTIQGFPTEPGKLVGMRMGGPGAMADLTAYQNVLMRQNAEGGHVVIPRSLSGMQMGGFSGLPQQQHQQSPARVYSGQQQRMMNAAAAAAAAAQAQPPLQHHMIHQLIQEMTTGNHYSTTTGGGGGRPPPSRSNSFKSDASATAGGGGGGGGFSQPQQNLHLSDELVQDIANEFSENGFLNADFHDGVCYAYGRHE